MKKINWGIIGLGKIAHKFAQDLQLSPTANLHGVASRSLTKAESFAKEHHAQNYFSSYEELAQHPDIDVIYIATPHVFHFENAMMCLQNGKAVLCEKPLGMNAQEVEKLIKKAREKNLFLMEGMWTRFIPAIKHILPFIEADEIGEIISVKADFGFKVEASPESRLLDKRLGAGSLLDIGIYPIYLSLLLLGMPSDVKAMARMNSDKIDTYVSMLLTFPSKAKAVLESTIETKTPTTASIYGTKGTLEIHSRFHHPTRFSIIQNGVDIVHEVMYKGNGYYHEIESVNQCLRKGLTENPLHTLKTSMELVKIMDKVRTEIGLTY